MRAGWSSGAIMDLGRWLRGLGLEQYEATFRDNAIDQKVLPRLTAEDLKDLGVGIVGIAVRCSTPSPSCALMPTRKHGRPTLFRQSTGLLRTPPSVAKSR